MAFLEFYNLDPVFSDINKKIRITFVITGLSAGGAEAMLFKLLQYIDMNCFKPIVISLTTMGEYGSRIESLGIPVFAMDMVRGRFNPFVFLELVKLIKRTNPDLVHTWMYHADLIGGCAARLAGCSKVIWCIRNSNLDKKLVGRKTLSVVKLCALLSKWIPASIISCSARAKDIHINFGYLASKMLVIPNGFELNKFRPDLSSYLEVRHELGLPHYIKLIGLIARYDPQKNHEGFLDAAYLVCNTLPDVNVLMVGKDVTAHNTKLVNKVMNLGIASKVHMLGKREDIPRLMAALDVLASSSHGEAFPNVLGEAMACGVPCVVTDVGDSAEIVGSTGRIVPPDDMNSLAKELIGMITVSESELDGLAQCARTRIVDNYDIENIVRLYEGEYKSIFENNSSGAR